MQKRATRPAWPLAARTPASAALIALILAAGLELSAVTMGSGGPGVGEEPTGLQGAEDGVSRHVNRGPVEQQASLTSEMAIALDLKWRLERRVAGRIYFRLRLSAAQTSGLHFGRKR